MQYTYVSGHQGQSKRLIIIFSGWGMDPRPFEGLRRPGYDIVILWDYRSLDFPRDIIAGYDEICVIAWSMGVGVASRIIPKLGDAVTLTVAVNGTLLPVDDTRGIPEAIFNGTLNGLNSRALLKFSMRMCGGAHAYESFRERMPDRCLEDLGEELAALGKLAAELKDTPCPLRKWDHAVVSLKDGIFPPANQQAAWKGCARSISAIGAPHLPDFQALIDHFVMNKDVVERRFERSSGRYEENALIQAEIVRELVETIRKAFPDIANPRILEIGSGTGLLSNPLLSMANEHEGSLELWDLVDMAPIHGIPFRSCDAESEIRNVEPESYAMIASSSTIQWLNSPSTFLHHCMKALKPGGLLAVSTFAMGNLEEVAQATGCFLPLMSEHSWQHTATELGDVVAIYSKRKFMNFNDPIEVFRHLKDTGVNALDAKESLIKSIDRYPREANGRCRLTYLPIFIVVRKR